MATPKKYGPVKRGGSKTKSPPIFNRNKIRTASGGSKVKKYVPPAKRRKGS